MSIPRRGMSWVEIQNMISNIYLLRQWKETKSISGQSKIKVTVMIVLTIGVSLVILTGRLGLQRMLIAIIVGLLLTIWRIKEL